MSAIVNMPFFIMACLVLTGCSTAEVDQHCNPSSPLNYWSSLTPVLACETGQVFSETFIQVEKGVAYSAGRGRK